VLLIGETGVGKSTWINAFANYCSFDSLQEAAQAGGLFPIRSTFIVTDPLTKEKITISSDGRFQITKPKAGESVTQNSNEYVFRFADIDVNLIDTPGLLDTRDVGKDSHSSDKKNIDITFKFLSNYQEIHAICIVIKANITRLSADFQYTLTEIFKRLDKSACNNVIFIFTNAASSNFKPDTTQPILQRFLQEKNIPLFLPPQKPTIYCFENGVMKFLAECKNKITHDEDDVQDAERSWRRSAKTTKELLRYTLSLKPHSLAVVMSINDATYMASVIPKLLLDIMELIFKDENKIEEETNKTKQLKKRNMGNHINLANDEIRSFVPTVKPTNVVCESARCAKVEAGHIAYPQVCCTACSCTGLNRYYCSRFNWLGDCTVCGCNKNQHRRRTTEKKDRVAQEYKEAEQMTKICAKLNAFALQNALLGASAEGDELLKSLEKPRQLCAWSTVTVRETNYLAEIKQQYEQQLKVAKSCRYTVEDVPKLIQELCKLPLKGYEMKSILDDYEKSRRAVVQERRKSKTTFIRPIGGVSGVTSYFPESAVSCATEQIDKHKAQLSQVNRESRSFKVIQGQHYPCQSKARARLPPIDCRHSGVQARSPVPVSRHSLLPSSLRSNQLQILDDPAENQRPAGIKRWQRLPALHSFVDTTATRDKQTKKTPYP